MVVEFDVSLVEELQLVDADGRLCGRAPDDDDATPFAGTVADACVHLAHRRRRARLAATERGLSTMAAGIHPAGHASLHPPRQAERPNGTIDTGTTDLFDMRIRIAMPSREMAVRAMCGSAPYLPALLALAGSSPFHRGEDTGYTSFRTVRRDVFPRVGPPLPVATADEFDRLERLFMGPGGPGERPLAWDVQPVVGGATLEFRLFDANPSLELVAFLAASARALAALFADKPPALPSGLEIQVLRENRWRAARYGLVAPFLRPDARPVTWPASAAATALAERLEPVADRLGDGDHIRQLPTLLEAGTAADAMRAAYSEAGSVRAVVDWLVRTTGGDA
ncbi:MAG TPA: glutamate-cysteine ligase family protein [Longimicrobiales bacterium]|nr:glutamate-cysteine ligase family protein [Longimicrobiales bacterium]